MLVPLFLIAGSILAVVHVLAIELYLYWRYPWMDWPMHFLGGIVVVLAIFTVASLRDWVSDHWLRFLSVMSMVATVAVAWEIYEVIIGTPRASNYALDTSVDLLLGLVGGAVGFYIARRFYYSKY